MGILRLRALLFILAILSSLLLVLGCFNTDKSNDGVARIDESNKVAAKTEKNDKAELTNEEKATQFVECMREHGFKDVKDPALNADGSINWGPIKESFGQLDRKNVNLRKAYDDCLPLLDDVTRTKRDSGEDKEEVQDQLLKYAECLREKGLKVPDPDFSPDGNMKGFLSDLPATAKTRRIRSECDGIVYGRTGKDTGKK